MLAALNIPAVVAGVVAGGLFAALLSLLVGGGLVILDVADGANIGLLIGVLTGLFVGGWVSGRMAVHSQRFHGSVSGLLLGGILILLASLASTTSSIFNVLVLALVCVVLGGAGGWFGGRRDPSAR